MSSSLIPSLSSSPPRIAGSEGAHSSGGAAGRQRRRRVRAHPPRRGQRQPPGVTRARARRVESHLAQRHLADAARRRVLDRPIGSRQISPPQMRGGCERSRRHGADDPLARRAPRASRGGESYAAVRHPEARAQSLPRRPHLHVLVWERQHPAGVDQRRGRHPHQPSQEFGENDPAPLLSGILPFARYARVARGRRRRKRRRPEGGNASGRSRYHEE